MEPRVLIIIPAYNEEESLGAVLQGLRRHTPGFDRVVVNDGSTDGTDAVVTALGEKQLRLVSNLGYGEALQTGMKYALICGYDIVVSIDADGQHRPEEVPRLVQTLIDENADLVIGSRFARGRSYDTPFSRRVGQLIFSHLTRILLDQRIYDTSSGFKVMTADACQALVTATFMDFHVETIVRLSMLGFKIMEAPITVMERSNGSSMHSIASIFQYPLKTLLLTMVAAMDVLIQRRTR